MSKIKRGFVLALFVIVLSMSLISADSCYVGECSSTYGIVSFYEQPVTNSHASTFVSSAYPDLCCDFSASRECTGLNTVLRLSSSTNAHIEGPQNTLYSVPVCYGDLQCIGTIIPGAYPDYNIQMIGLSYSGTNSHAGQYSDSNYPYKIICKHKPTEADPNAEWMNTEVTSILSTATFTRGSTTTITYILNNSGQLIWEDTDTEIFEYDADTQTTVLGREVSIKPIVNSPKDGVPFLQWEVTFDDSFIDDLVTGEGDNILELYFQVSTTQGAVYTSDFLNLFITGDGNAYWRDPSTTQLISELEYTGIAKTVQMVLADSGFSASEVNFSYYQSEPGSSIEGGTGTLLGSTVKSSEVPTDSGSELYFPLTINDVFLATLEGEDNYQLYFKAFEISNPINSWTGDILTITRTEEPPVVVQNSSTSYWMNSPPTTNLSSIVLTEEGQKITMVLAGSGLTTETAIFSVHESDGGAPDLTDGSIVSSNDGIISITELATGDNSLPGGVIYQELVLTSASLSELDALGQLDEDHIYEIYFTVNDNVSLQSGIITVDASALYEPVYSWMDLYGEQTITSFQYFYGDTETVTLVVENSGLSPVASVLLDIKEEDGGAFCSDNNIRTVIGTVNSAGTLVAFWTMNETDFENAIDTGLCFDERGYLEDNDYEFYFEVASISSEKSPELNTTYSQEILCLSINQCVDYTEQVPCNTNECNIVPELPECSDPNYECSCVWDTNADPNSCGPAFTSSYNGIEIGTCVHSTDLSSDDCEDGFLSYNWTARWNWSPSNPTMPGVPGVPCTDPDYVYSAIDGLCHYDPIGSAAKCQGGSNVVACPAQIQLSFFSTLNIIAAVILLIIVYYLLKDGKNKKKKLSKKKVSNKKK